MFCTCVSARQRGQRWQAPTCKEVLVVEVDVEKACMPEVTFGSTQAKKARSGERGREREPNRERESERVREGEREREKETERKQEREKRGRERERGPDFPVKSPIEECRQRRRACGQRNTTTPIAWV